MRIHNRTSWPMMHFPGLDLDGRKFRVCLLKAAYSLPEPGDCRLSPVAADFIFADEYEGAAGESSLKRASDLAQFKPRADIYFVGAVAQAPAGRLAREWFVNVDVGRLSASWRVTGPRSWRRGPVAAWTLGEPEVCSSVPMRFEYAYGGVEHRKEKIAMCESNPVGIGFATVRGQLTTGTIAAPQITVARENLPRHPSAVTPAALGPVAPAWASRRRLAGTFDAEWKSKRWPLMPRDFDYAFYNVAPAGLQYPGFLRGDESVSLRGLHAGGTIEFRLPGDLSPALTMRHGSEGGEWAKLVLDTLVFDMDAKRVECTWRACFVPSRDGFNAELHPIKPKELIHAPEPAWAAS